MLLYSWAGFVLSRELDKKKFQTVVVSPRSYFVFTPLLASTAVGTLEFRTTLESVRARRAGVEFVQGWGDDINFNEKTLQIEQASIRKLPQSASGGDAASLYGSDVTTKKKGQVFDLKYDKLVVAVGCYSQTFGTAGVREHALFLKDVLDAVKIRKRVLECKSMTSPEQSRADIPGFETASLPTTSPELRNKLLNFAIVGGGRKSVFIYLNITNKFQPLVWSSPPNSSISAMKTSSDFTQPSYLISI
jgi:NADH dehydrogenase FAD-containing subunit